MAASLFGSRHSVDLSHKLHKNTANSQQIGNFHQKILTRMPDYGLMRPVARIAQSVEQGIENPRVLGSIPSSGTTILEALQKCGALSFLSHGLFMVVTAYLLHSSV